MPAGEQADGRELPAHSLGHAAVEMDPQKPGQLFPPEGMPPQRMRNLPRPGPCIFQGERVLTQTTYSAAGPNMLQAPQADSRSASNPYGVMSPMVQRTAI